MAAPEIHLFLPQMRMSFGDLVARAQAAEGAGFDGLALMDHLAPPRAEQHDMYEAIVTAGWLLAHTSTLTVGHLVLFDSLRHPAVLARQAVSLDHASGGRFELGIGWGSVPEELGVYGVPELPPRARVARLDESLAVMRGLWSGEPVDHAGEHFTLVDARQRPVPTRPIPIVIGGAGPRTLALVAEHADWWNLPVYGLDRLDELRPQVGDARVSTQQMVTFVPAGADRDEIVGLARRRFGAMGGDGAAVGNGAELVDHLKGQQEQGIERFYLWFTDFAPPATLAAFGDEVIARLGG